MSLRTEETENRYQTARRMGWLKHLASEQRLPGAPEFRLWLVIDNRFPHDKHHVRNHLVVLKRDTPIDRISTAEWEEFWRKVVPWAETQRYDYVKFNLSSVRSITTTPHLHLLELKKEYK